MFLGMLHGNMGNMKWSRLISEGFNMDWSTGIP